MESPTLPKPKRVRSSSYPAINLEKAIEHIKTIKNSLGKGSFSRDSAARALNYSGISGKSATVTAALVHYGLLTRKGNTYSVSELSDEIIAYRNDAERQRAVVKAAKSPKLYSNLLKAFGGGSLPLMLSHILARDYHINDKVAPEVAKKFTSSMTFAGLLVNGVLASPGEEVKVANPPDNQTTVASRLPMGNLAEEDSGSLRTNTYNQMQHMDIVDGVVVSIRADRAFDVLTNSKVTEALRDLKSAIEPRPSDDDNQTLKSSDGTH